MRLSEAHERNTSRRCGPEVFRREEEIFTRPVAMTLLLFSHRGLQPSEVKWLCFRKVEAKDIWTTR